MKTFSVALNTSLVAPVTTPGYLIRLGYASPLYFATREGITWDSVFWSPFNIAVAGLSQDGSANTNITISIGNTDNAIGAICLLEGASDIPIKVYAYYAEAIAAGDPYLVFEGSANGATISTVSVDITAVAQNNSNLYSPRVFISKPTFNFLQPEGTQIYFGTETFILERP